MSSDVGDIKLTQCKIGQVDLLGPEADPYYINVYENILSSYGPAAEIRVVDVLDASQKINGSYDEDIIIEWSLAEGSNERNSFKLKPLESKDLTSHEFENRSPDNNKQYTIRAIAAEALNAQGNPVQKSWKDKTTNMIKEILEKNYKTELQVEIQEQSKDQIRFVAGNEHPKNVNQKLLEESTGTESKSSAFTVFQQQKNGNSKYIISTYEKLFQQSPVEELKLRSDTNSSNMKPDERIKSIISFKAPENFFSGSRHLKNSSENSVNLLTHKVTAVPPVQNRFKLPGREVDNAQQPSANLSIHKILSKNNHDQRNEVATSKRNRAEFLTHLAENSAIVEVYGNPKIILGSIVNLEIPRRVATQDGGSERQFNGPVLVTEIKHQVKPMGETPRYTQVLRVIKASYNG